MEGGDYSFFEEFAHGCKLSQIHYEIIAKHN